MFCEMSATVRENGGQPETSNEDHSTKSDHSNDNAPPDPVSGGKPPPVTGFEPALGLGAPADEGPCTSDPTQEFGRHLLDFKPGNCRSPCGCLDRRLPDASRRGYRQDGGGLTSAGLCGQSSPLYELSGKRPEQTRSRCLTYSDDVVSDDLDYESSRRRCRYSAMAGDVCGPASETDDALRGPVFGKYREHFERGGSKRYLGKVASSRHSATADDGKGDTTTEISEDGEMTFSLLDKYHGHSELERNGYFWEPDDEISTSDGTHFPSQARDSSEGGPKNVRRSDSELADRQAADDGQKFFLDLDDRETECFPEQSPWECSAGHGENRSSPLEPFWNSSYRSPDDPGGKQAAESNRFQRRSAKSPAPSFRRHFDDGDFRFEFGRFQSDHDRPCFNVRGEDWSRDQRAEPDIRFPDEELSATASLLASSGPYFSSDTTSPKSKRFKASLLAQTSSRVSTDEPPIHPAPFKFRFPGPTQSVAGQLLPSSSGPGGLAAAEKCGGPTSRIFSSRSVALMQSRRGVHLVTEETVAKTVFGDSPRAAEYSVGEAGDGGDRNGIGDGPGRAGFTADRRENGGENVGTAAVLSPDFVVRRMPPRIKSASAGGGKDRDDIAGSWKPVSGHTVVRKSNNQKSQAAATSERGRNLCDGRRLWTTFDRSCGTAREPQHTEGVDTRERCSGNVAKDRGDPSAAQRSGLPASRGRSLESVIKKLVDLGAENADVDVDSAPMLYSRHDGTPTTSFSNGLEVGGGQKMAGHGHMVFGSVPDAATNRVRTLSTDRSDPSLRFGASESGCGGGVPSQTVRSSCVGAGTDEAADIRKRISTDGDRLASVSVGFPDNPPGVVSEISVAGENFEPGGTRRADRSGTADGGGAPTSKWNKFQENSTALRRRMPPVVETVAEAPCKNRETVGSDPTKSATTAANLTGTHASAENADRYQEPLVQTPRSRPQSSVPNVAKKTPNISLNLATTPISTHTADHHEPPTCLSNQARRQSSASNVVRTLVDGSYQGDAGQPRKPPEVACVTPQVRRPLRALQLDAAAQGSATAENGEYNQSGRSGLVVARLPAARESPGSNRAADKGLCFHENHCDTQIWARAAHWLQCLGRLSLPPSEGR